MQTQTGNPCHFTMPAIITIHTNLQPGCPRKWPIISNNGFPSDMKIFKIDADGREEDKDMSLD